AHLRRVRAGLPGAGRDPRAAAGRGDRGTGAMNPVDGTAGIRGHREVDEVLLDDPEALERNDPGGMLRATAAAGAQVRESAALAAEANLAVLADEGRPRSVVVAGVGTAARTCDLLETVAGPRCPVPVLAHRTAGIPGRLGAADAVTAV